MTLLTDSSSTSVLGRETAAVLVARTDGVIVATSREAEPMLGRPVQELIGRQFVSAVLDDEHRIERDLVNHLLTLGKSGIVEAFLRRRVRVPVWLRFHFRAIPAAEGRPPFIVIVCSHAGSAAAQT
ncbi:MAG: PAS domain-containing protein [Pseudomonadota bacterium]